MEQQEIKFEKWEIRDTNGKIIAVDCLDDFNRKHLGYVPAATLPGIKTLIVHAH
jgi:hypothetical protein